MKRCIRTIMNATKKFFFLTNENFYTLLIKIDSHNLLIMFFLAERR